ncbi:HRDC domain-containing protein, partial [Candidatus Saccharibacteria bacterium]|nr:HRDC domain-containing protein [Candidatus Saccharibacteria bacterium]
MALQLHPEIHDLDSQLRQHSDKLAATTEDAPEAKPKTKSKIPQPNKKVLSALKDWRLKRSKEDKLPAYIIAHDSALEAVAVKQPKTASQLLSVKGFGMSKIDKYGPEIIQVVSDNTTP